MNPHDAHRPVQPNEDLAQIFTWQEERTVTRNLVVHFRRLTLLIVPSPETLALAGVACAFTSRRMARWRSTTLASFCPTRCSTSSPWWRRRGG